MSAQPPNTSGTQPPGNIEVVSDPDNKNKAKPTTPTGTMPMGPIPPQPPKATMQGQGEPREKSEEEAEKTIGQEKAPEKPKAQPGEISWPALFREIARLVELIGEIKEIFKKAAENLREKKRLEALEKEKLKEIEDQRQKVSELGSQLGETDPDALVVSNKALHDASIELESLPRLESAGKTPVAIVPGTVATADGAASNPLANKMTKVAGAATQASLTAAPLPGKSGGHSPGLIPSGGPSTEPTSPVVAPPQEAPVAAPTKAAVAPAPPSEQKPQQEKEKPKPSPGKNP